MFKTYTEYRETQQLRKDHLAQQNRRYALIAMAILIPLFAILAVVEAKTPDAPAKPVPVVSPANQQERQDIEEFADDITKPAYTLSSDDLDFVGEKAKDPCYEKSADALLPKEQMIAAITACKGAS
jgi:hypothetical protein